jgi:HAD superfamily hydrolase (TIGR01549 family)
LPADAEVLTEDNMKRVRWIFFDLGWTLVDETDSHSTRIRAARRQLARLGKHHSVNELLEICERAATDFAPSPFREMLARLDLPDDQVATLMDTVRYVTENEVLYPRVPELLATLSKRFRLGVIANQSEGTESRLVRWRIRDYFSLIFASAEFGLAKPDPQIFAAALSQAQCEPEEALMVGDRLDNDIGPAKSQGWKTVRVLPGFSRFQEPRSPHEIPDIIISGIEELSGDHVIF